MIGEVDTFPGVPYSHLPGKQDNLLLLLELNPLPSQGTSLGDASVSEKKKDALGKDLRELYYLLISKNNNY